MLTHSETELTTAATDLLIAIAGIWLACQIGAVPTEAVWRQHVWIGVFALLSSSALLGTVVHGFDLSDTARATLWKPLLLCLGSIVGLLIVCAVSDWLGESAGRRALPFAAAISAAFFLLIQLRRSGFAFFLAFGGVGMIFPLAVYSSLALRHEPGALLVAAGLVVTVLGAAVQRSRLSVRAFVRFDHNGLFHVVQLVGMVLIAAGVEEALRP